MRVKELKELLNRVPDETEIFYSGANDVEAVEDWFIDDDGDLILNNHTTY